jgi:hypothetical protein
MLIALSGRKHSGKSTLANHAKRVYGFTIVSPIDPLKHFAVDQLGFTTEQMWGSSSARDEAHPTLLRADGTPLTGRGFLDDVGAAIVRCCPSGMADACMRRTFALARSGYDVVNESCRRLSELESMKRAGAKLIRRRGGLAPTHEIDAEIDAMPDSYFDAVLPVFDTKEQLYAAVDILMAGWLSEST